MYIHKYAFVSFLLLALSVSILPKESCSQEFELIRNSSGKVIAAKPVIGKTASLSAGSSTDPRVTVSRADAALAALATSYKAFANDALKELAPVHYSHDKIGNQRIIYNQIAKGFLVKNRQVSVYMDSAGQVTFIKGNTVKDLIVDPLTKVDASEAIYLAKSTTTKATPYKNAKKIFKRSARKKCSKRQSRTKRSLSVCLSKQAEKFDDLYAPIQDQAPSLQVLTEAQSAGRLVWSFKLVHPDLNHEIFEIDAVSGDIIKRKMDIDHSTRQVYDCGQTFANPNFCYLNYFTTTYGQIYYFGRGEGYDPVGPSPVPGFTGSTDVDFFFEQSLPSINDYFLARFNRVGGNGFGGTVAPTATEDNARARIFANAQKTETGLNACAQGYPAGWRGSTGISLCQGSRNDELLAHEYAHVITDFLIVNPDWTTVGLQRSGETGSLDESFGDILGESYEYYKTGTNDWIFLPEAGADARHAHNPGLTSYDINSPGTSVPYPDNFNSAFFYCGAENSGGIHHNSTVPSKAAYLASVGGDFNGCSIQGIGLEKVEQIWYRGVTNYFLSSEQFNDAYVSLNQACHDLATTPTLLSHIDPPLVISLEDCDEFEKALQAVEMDKEGFCNGGVPGEPTCKTVIDPMLADFDDNGVVDLWDYNFFKREFLGYLTTKNSDTNGDDVIDQLDYEFWLSIYEGADPPLMPTIKGDCDGDSDVDGRDFLEWQRSYGSSGPALGCDMNSDGSIDAADYTIWRNNYGSGTQG